MTKAKHRWSGMPIDRVVDAELKNNPLLRRGMSAYAHMIAGWRKYEDWDALRDALMDLAGAEYRAAGRPGAVLHHIHDGASDFLFDIAAGRTLLACAITTTVAPGTRDDSYHKQYPSAGAGMDKGHAIAHAHGGREGGPNYISQNSLLNRGWSRNGQLWRAIERYLAANPDLPVFVRMLYAPANDSAVPDELEYGILSATGQFRVVIFPNR